METIQQNVVINAHVATVYTIMLGKDTFPLWTRAFNPTSYYEGSWEEGSEIRFLGINEDGKKEGMYSRIKENRANEFVSIEHVGIIKDDQIDTTSDEVKKWAPSFENYSFEAIDNATTLVKLEMQIDAVYVAEFNQMWAKALQLLKSMCEAA